MVHGGAWDIKDDHTDRCREGIGKGLDAGSKVLMDGGTALDAVVAAVSALEDHPAFDAGHGSFLNGMGEVEMDAAIMDGPSKRWGAVAAVQRVKNPVTLARKLMDVKWSYMMVGSSAEEFARENGITMCETEELLWGRELKRYRELSFRDDYDAREIFENDTSLANVPDNTPSAPLITPSPHGSQEDPRGDEGYPDPNHGDTVGAIAIDTDGRLASASSTGGTPMKHPGRVGDTPLIGSGIYAVSDIAVAATGYGEKLMRCVFSQDVARRVQDGLSIEEALEASLKRLVVRVNGLGGSIVLTANGRMGLAHNTPRMAWGAFTGGRRLVGVHQDEWDPSVL